MSNDLTLQVKLGLIEKVIAPLKKIAQGSAVASKSLKEARDQIKELNKAQSDITGYRRTAIEIRQRKRDLDELTHKSKSYNTILDDQRARHENIKASLKSAKHQYDSLTKAFADGGTESAAYGRKLELARISLLSTQQAHERSLASITKYKAQVKNVGLKLTELSAQQKGAEQRLSNYKDKLDKAGIGTDSLSSKSKSMRIEHERMTTALKAQEDRLKAVGIEERRLADLRAKLRKQLMNAGIVGGVGYGMQAAGSAGVRRVMQPVNTFASHEDAMLGIARQVNGARGADGKLTSVYRKIEQQVRDLSTQVPIATTQIAEMFTAAARMEVPTDQLKEFTRLASMMATAFDAVPSEITEAMGKVAKNFKMPITQIEGLADAINYLDDNAISKGGDIIDYLNRTSGVASTVAISAKDVAALGSTLLTLGERTETAGTATNAMLTKFAAATKGTKKFKEAVAEIGLTTEGIQKGMATDATGTLLKVIEAIKSLPKDKQIGVMAELVGLEHSDTLAKLVDKAEELRRQLNLANGNDGKGSMRREADARNQTYNAQKQMFMNRLFNLSTVFGETLKPTLEALMQVVNPLLAKFTQWVQNNPELVGGIMKAALAVTALIATVGAILIPLALVAAKVMLFRYGLGMLGVQGLAVTGVIKGIGTAIGFVGRALMLTPIGRVLAGAAVLGTGVYTLIQSYNKPSQAPRGGSSPMRFDARPPLMAAGAAGGAASTNNVTINAQGNSNPEDIAKAVQRALDDLDRKKRAGARSSLTDH